MYHREKTTCFHPNSFHHPPPSPRIHVHLLPSHPFARDTSDDGNSNAVPGLPLPHPSHDAGTSCTVARGTSDDGNSSAVPGLLPSHPSHDAGTSCTVARGTSDDSNSSAVPGIPPYHPSHDSGTSCTVTRGTSDAGSSCTFTRGADRNSSAVVWHSAPPHAGHDDCPSCSTLDCGTDDDGAVPGTVSAFSWGTDYNGNPSAVPGLPDADAGPDSGHDHPVELRAGQRAPYPLGQRHRLRWSNV